MYELTIRTDAVSCTTRHAGAAEAHRALLAHAVDADLYLLARPGTRMTSTARVPAVGVVHLLRMERSAADPRCVGTATITATDRDPTGATTP